MKANRVECDQCISFIDPVFKEPDNLFSPIIQRAKCKRGKRVMYRMPKPTESYNFIYEGGYIRFCNKFKTK